MSLSDAQRAKFLAWAADRWRADDYRHTSETSGEWDAWQAAIASQAAEMEALRAKVAEWEKLRDPVTLHVSLLRGFPARLSRAVFLHLAGDEEPKF